MSTDYRATPEQWDSIEQCADGCESYSCILELRARIEALEACYKEDANCWSAVRASMHAIRARIEALEAAQKPPQDKLDRLIALDADDGDPIVMPSSPADSLIDRVSKAIYDAPNTHEGWRTEARAAILEVAAWLSKEPFGLSWATRLEREANQ